MRDAKMGSLEIKVDGKVVGTIAEANPDFVHTYPYHVIHLDSPGNHKVELTLKQRGSVTTPWFGLCAIGGCKPLTKHILRMPAHLYRQGIWQLFRRD